MIKSVVVHDIPLDAIPAMERWYYRDHAPEIARRYGPWLARHESYLPLPAPPEAEAYGFYNWRVTECYWRAMVNSAEMFYRASLERKESRGWQIREDYPDRDDKNWLKWVIVKDVDGEMIVSTEAVPIERYPVRP